MITANEISKLLVLAQKAAVVYGPKWRGLDMVTYLLRCARAAIYAGDQATARESIRASMRLLGALTF